MPERNLIFCFSGTGNSYYVAREIAVSLKNCEIASMGRSFELTGSYNRIGFVFPSHAMGLPTAVLRFIKSLDLLDNEHTYFFTVVTCGFTGGNSINKVRKLLRRGGARLSYGVDINMFSNYVGLYKMKDNPEEQAEFADEQLKPVLRNIAKCHVHDFPEGGNFAVGWIHGIAEVTFPGKDKRFAVSQNCTGCGICAKICPVDNIEQQGREITYKHRCQQCMACIQWCPVQAIQAGAKTADRGRYHHPSVTCDEMIRLARSKAPFTLSNALDSEAAETASL